jgi:predicted dehydrogenase
MDEPAIRLGYIGAGNLAQRVHLPNFAALPGCELVALAEVRADLGERVRRRHGIERLYPDHRAMLAEADIDAVAVSAGWALQAELARDCLAAGKHVFMEKPMAVSVAQGERLLAAGRATGARLMVGYMKRYDAGNELAQATVAGWRRDGSAGAITYARAHGFGGDWIAGLDVPVEESTESLPPAPTEENLPDWLPPERGRAFAHYLQQYVHNLNLLRFLLDGGAEAHVRYADLDADGYGGVAILEVGGVRCSLETGQLDYHRWDEHTQVYFERGWVHTWAPPLLLRNSVAEVEIYRAAPEGAPADTSAGAARHVVSRPLAEPRWSWAYTREAEHFIDCLRTGAPFRSPGEDALTDVRLCEEIYRNWLQR